MDLFESKWIGALGIVALLGLGCGRDANAPEGAGGGGGSGGSGGGFNNQAACEEFINTYNGLSCVNGAASLDAQQVCASYTDNTIDCSNIFNCWTDNLECVDYGGGVESPSNYTSGCPTVCG